jgi:hypothetical protein
MWMIERTAARFLALATLVALALAFVAAPASAGTSGTIRWVDDDGHAGGAHGCSGGAAAPTNIQDAVDLTVDGDTVKVCPGVYRGEVLIETSITLAGVKPFKAVLKPAVIVTAGADPLVRVEATDNVTIRWLKISIPATGACDFQYNGILVNSSHNVKVRGNQIVGGPGGNPSLCGLVSGVIYSNSSGLVAWNVIRRFTTAGVAINAGSDVRIVKNAIRIPAHTTCTAVTAVCTAGSVGQVGIDAVLSHALIRGNVIRTKAGGPATASFTIGIRTDHVIGTIRDNLVVGASYGLWLGYVGGTIYSNTIKNGAADGIVLDGGPTTGELHDNRVMNMGGYGILIDASTQTFNVHDNDFSGNGSTDCVDGSSPNNTWTNNTGDESNPAGLCTPAP